MRDSNIGRFLQICIELAEIVDEKGESGDAPYCDDLGLGYRVVSGYLRKGVKEVIDLQSKYHRTVESKNLAKIGEEEAHDFLEEVFGDREPYTINDKDKDRIKTFVRSIMLEWETGEGDAE